MLVVAWKLKAENLGFFKFSEWSTGMGSMQYVFHLHSPDRPGGSMFVITLICCFKQV